MQPHFHADSKTNRRVSLLACSTSTQGPSQESLPRSPRSIVFHHLRTVRHPGAQCKMVLLGASDARDPGVAIQTTPTLLHRLRRATKCYTTRQFTRPTATKCNKKLPGNTLRALPRCHRRRSGRAEITEQTTTFAATPLPLRHVLVPRPHKHKPPPRSLRTLRGSPCPWGSHHFGQGRDVHD